VIRPLAALAAVVLAVTALAGCGGDRQLVGIARDVPAAVDQTPLPDETSGGDPFTFRAPAGGLLLVYFGYTHCPDVCPGTLTAVHRALDELGDDADRVEVAMVSVDPARDQGELAAFVTSFVAGAHGVVTDDLSAVRRLALSFGADFVTVEGGDPTHTDALYAVDDQGGLVITWTYPTPYDDIAGDIAQLLDQAGD